MKKRKSLTVKRIEAEVEPLTCERCRYYYPIDDKTGFCFKRIQTVYRTFNCAKGERGEPITELTSRQKAEILKRYVEFEIFAKSVTETLNAFRTFIAHAFENGERYGRYKVVNREYERRIIDSAKVRELLKQLPDGDRYFKTVRSRYLRVIDTDLDR